MAQEMNLKRAEDADKIFVVRQLNTLLEMEGNFLASYDLVLERLTDDDLKSQVRDFRGDHERHVEALQNAVDSLGGEAFDPPGPSPAFKLEARYMGKADVQELLVYFELGERQSVWLYDAARSVPGLPGNVNDVLEAALQDEQRHHAWALNQVGAFTREGTPRTGARPT